MLTSFFFSIKSREEYLSKKGRGDVYSVDSSLYNEEAFNSFDRNEEFDNGTLKYRAERAKNFRPPDNSHADERLFAAPEKNIRERHDFRGRKTFD